MPHSAEAEQSVIGAMMLSPDVADRCIERLGPADFFIDINRRLFVAIRDLRTHGQPVDGVTLSEREPELSVHAMHCAETTPGTANVAAYINIVLEHRARRDFLDVAGDIAEAVHRGHSPDAILTRALARVTSVRTVEASIGAEPANLLGDDDPPECRPEDLPPPIAAFAFDQAQVMGTSPDVIALSALLTCSAAMDQRFQVQPKPSEPGWKESPRLWGLVVGDASVRKTAPMKYALRPLLDINTEMADRYTTKRAEYEREMKVHKLREAAAARVEAKGEDAGDPIPVPDRPANARLVVNDPTIEALAELCADNPRGMLFYRDELAGWFASMDAYRGTGVGGRDRSAWLEAYGGGSFIVDRISRGTTTIENWSVGVLGTIQPDRIRSMADKMDDDGLLQRFMVVTIPVADRRETDTVPNATAYKAYCRIVEHLARTNADGYQVIQFSPEASQVWREVCDFADSLKVAETLPVMLRSHVGKWSGLFARLCAVYHGIGCAARGIYPTSKPVSGQTASRVANLMKRWLLPHAMSFYGLIASHATGASAIVRDLASTIVAEGFQSLTRRDAGSKSRAFREAPLYMQETVLRILINANWLLAETEVEGGDVRDQSRFPVNPAVHQRFANHAAKAVARRARARAGHNLIREVVPTF